uniref:Bifunctional inhibitor/plant lipid transfer protein/seed storage helical domain-containing protein n=2 Tax=Oryza brachyantha TaxID=4533 RepID=J3LTM5_ORYBR
MGAARGNGGSVLGLGVAVAVTVALLACRCAAQTPSASSTTTGGSGCMPELVSLSPCMGFMSGSATAPAAACCSALSGVLRSNPGCLCMVLGGTAASLGVAVDTARAVLLPGACSIQAPSASQCNALEAPMPSPASPAPPVATPATPTEPSGTPGSKTTPTPFTHYSDGSMMNPRMMFIVVVVVIVALLDHL